MQSNEYLGEGFGGVPLAMYDFGARMYDPEVMHFWAQDPMYQFDNPYEYCGDDPVNGYDPDGMFSWSDLAKSTANPYYSLLVGVQSLDAFAQWTSDHSKGVEIGVVVAASIIVTVVTEGILGEEMADLDAYIIAQTLGGAVAGAGTAAVNGGGAKAILYGGIEGAFEAYVLGGLFPGGEEATAVKVGLEAAAREAAEAAAKDAAEAAARDATEAVAGPGLPSLPKGASVGQKVLEPQDDSYWNRLLNARTFRDDMGTNWKVDNAGRIYERVPVMGDAPAVGGPANGAKLASNGVKLSKQLASEAQMAESGRTIIGSGKLTEAARLAKQYGGKAVDWVKKSSSSFTKNGTTFETHWYENIITRIKVEFKTKFP